MKNKIVLVSLIMGLALLLAKTSLVMAYNDPGPASAPVCSKEKPQKAWLYRIKSLGKGKYELFWDKANNASSWTVGYGTQSGKYIYSINDFGNDQSRSLVVNTFSNKKMYFVVKANNGCMPGEWSNEWKTGGVAAAVGTYVPAAVKKTTTAPVVTKAPAKETVKKTVTTAPVKETVKETAPVKEVAPVVTPAPVKGGFMNWLKGLFR